MNKLSKNPLHFFNSAKAENVLTLDVMDCIGKDMFGDGISAQDFSDAIAEAGDFSSIVVNLNSPGGDLYDGVAAFNLLRATGVPITCNVIGLCASAASLIMIAGDKRIMMAGTTLMIHSAQAICAGYASDMVKMAEVLTTVSDSAADIYTTRTGMSKADVLKAMTNETWYTPQQAVDAKFATALAKEKGITNSFDLKMFKNAPDTLKDSKVAELSVVVITNEVSLQERISDVQEALNAKADADYCIRLKQIALRKKRK